MSAAINVKDVTCHGRGLGQTDDVGGAKLSALHLQLPHPRGVVFFLHGNTGNLETWLAEITGYDTTPAEARCEAIVANASATFPELPRHFERKAARFWAGLRPVTPAGTPIIGRTTLDNLWVNAGHGHLGWTFACGSGRVLADLIDGRAPGITPPQPQGAVLAPGARTA